MRLLEGEGLFKSFGGLQVIQGISFSLDERETLGIIGPNGSGKTTLFNLISGYLKPDSGNIIFSGKNITGKGPSDICKAGIARTFQIVRPFVQLTALDNVAAGRSYGREPAKTLKEAQEEASELLRMVGLGNKEHIYAGDLTLLERKKLEIARALATRPKLLLLDEVFAGLNPVEVDEALRLISKIKSMGITMMVVEHVIKVILNISDRVVVISSGSKIFEGPPEDAIEDKKVCEAYLGEKYYA
ncbi:MAG: ABC transporter ATP-binding protein [Syntrophorhabdaceae bacterium]|nr:ABC transporter ATP-binding protein [Syntrophorhabdaceae bacterium]